MVSERPEEGRGGGLRDAVLLWWGRAEGKRRPYLSPGRPQAWSAQGFAESSRQRLPGPLGAEALLGFTWPEPHKVLDPPAAGAWGGVVP